MFFKPKPNIDDDELAWQLDCWHWLMDNLGGLMVLHERKTQTPNMVIEAMHGISESDFPSALFGYLADAIGVDASDFDLVAQEASINPVLGDLAIVQNAPQDAGGTYSASSDSNRHVVTYDPALMKDPARLIAVFAHEICHAILFSIAEPPPSAGEEAVVDGVDYAEEFATDLACVFMGFGIFNGNAAFEYKQSNEGWSFSRLGYLTQNEWSFALAVRTELLNENPDVVIKNGVFGLAQGHKQNLKYLRKNPLLLEPLSRG